MVEEGGGCPGVAPQQGPVEGGAARRVPLPHRGPVPGEVRPPRHLRRQERQEVCPPLAEYRRGVAPPQSRAPACRGKLFTNNECKRVFAKMGLSKHYG